MTSPRVLVPLAPGFEEIEAMAIIDVLRRAEVEVVTAGLDSDQVEGSHGVTVRADRRIEDCDMADFSAIVLPGGMPGAQHLHDDARVQERLVQAHERGLLIGAICAAPMALVPGGITRDRRVTSYPSFKDRVPAGAWVDENVVEDGPVVTSRGVGTALAFALTLVRRLRDPSVADRLAGIMLVRPAQPAKSSQ
ncbi:MAG: DJ-1/PfpI family protein [Planctomycetes bacterium]|nr:DJ-1/PfpI family protein [Planctomycetota bacterium]